MDTPTPRPSEFVTEWGVVSPWGTQPAASFAAATRTAANMTKAGHDARVIWRAVSDWQDVL